MIKQILILGSIIMSGQLFAQATPDTVSFPIPLRPGDRFTVQKEYLTQDGTYQVNVLYLLKDSQVRNLVKKSQKQPIDSTMASVLSQQVDILKLITTEKDSIISLNREGYLHYRDLWEETDRKLEEEEIKSARNFRWGFYVGTAVSIATITAFKLIAN